MANEQNGQADVTGTEARGGSKEGVVRYVLVASLALIIVLFAIVLFVAA